MIFEVGLKSASESKMYGLRTFVAWNRHNIIWYDIIERKKMRKNNAHNEYDELYIIWSKLDSVEVNNIGNLYAFWMHGNILLTCYIENEQRACAHSRGQTLFYHTSNFAFLLFCVTHWIPCQRYVYRSEGDHSEENASLLPLPMKSTLLYKCTLFFFFFFILCMLILNSSLLLLEAASLLFKVY